MLPDFMNFSGKRVFGLVNKEIPYFKKGSLHQPILRNQYPRNHSATCLKSLHKGVQK